MSFLEKEFYSIPVQDWLVAAATTLGLLLIFWIIRFVFFRFLAAKAAEDDDRIRTLVGKIIRKTSIILFAIFAIFIGALTIVDITEAHFKWVQPSAIAIVLIQLAIWGNVLIGFWVLRVKKRHIETDAARVTTVQAMAFVARLLLFALIFLMALQNFGVNITTLVASLGVGGIAVALAVQNILGDLFASLSISLDKPFVIGDFIIVDSFLGSVEKIGLKTTRIRSLSGEQLIFSNNDLLSSRIRNYKRMFERRIVFAFGVIYQTKSEDLERIPAMVREIIESIDQTRFDRAHFKAFGAYSLDFEVVYYVLAPDYNLYMDIQQKINLTLFKRFEQEGIEFAYPTQLVYVDKTDGSGELTERQ